MLHDYCPNKKSKKSNQKKKIKLNQKLLISLGLVGLVLLLSFLAIKIELSKLFRLKENQRVLLVKDHQPLAILFFNADNKQLLVTDLRQRNFDLSALEQEATLSGNTKEKLIYSFLLDTAFDQSYEYSSNNLDKQSLLDFFKDQKIYYFFLKDQELLWREQDYEQEINYMVKPVFDCPVALINTTGEAGLASSLSKILEKSSFSIIKKDNNAENLEQTKIIYNPEEESCAQLLKKLDKILPQSLIVADKNETLENRSAMVIYIGRDLADLYVFFVDLFHGQL